ncbi:MAG: hypothetical protein MJ247_07740 [Alphaproteobacteria bacterium]|nr:hypothetical protein [Alphaproteobacteria bacterium]
MSCFKISPIFKKAPNLKFSKRLCIFIKYVFYACTKKLIKWDTNEIEINGKKYIFPENKFNKYRIHFFYKCAYEEVPVKQLWRDYGNGKDFYCSPMYNYMLISSDKDELKHEKRLKALLKNIEKNGYDKTQLVVINQYNFVYDGAHRVAAALFLYGEDFKIPCLKLYTRWSRPLYGVRLKKGEKRYYFLTIQIWKKKVYDYVDNYMEELNKL